MPGDDWRDAESQWPDFEKQNNNVNGLFGPGSAEVDTEDYQEDIPDEQEGNHSTGEVKKVKRERKQKKSEGEKLTQYRSAKYSERQIEQLEKIKLAMGTTNEGEVLRWALDEAYRANKKKIERIVEEKQRIETL